jgi:hypothetical protein
MVVLKLREVAGVRGGGGVAGSRAGPVIRSNLPIVIVPAIAPI